MNLSGNSKKVLGIICIILAVAVIVISVFTKNKGGESYKEENTTAALSKEETTESLETYRNVVDTADQGRAASEEKKKLEDIVSPVKYEIHPEIEAILDPEVFDKELCSFLKKKGKLKEGSYEGNATGIILARSTPYLKKSLDDGSYLFDITITDENRSIITVVVDPEGGYFFDLI